MHIILLSGGSGARLWPLSNEVRSKQFIKIFRSEDGTHESMVQRMYRMIKEVAPDADITIATSRNQVSAIKNQLGDDVDISTEPCRMDTFPAIALSVAYLHDVKDLSLDESVVICPVDPLVDKAYFEALKEIYNVSGEANLTLMGITPTYPSGKYGYIMQKNGEIVFKEKPTEEVAEEYIKEGALWNGGVFGFKISYLLNKAQELCGTSNYFDLLANYRKLKKISFDYAVAEHEKSIKVVKYTGEWKDLGTWNTFTEAMTEETGGNVIMGENCQNVHVINELSIPVIALGLKDVVVAASPDGILVAEKEASASLKTYVPNNRPMFEKKAWGEYRVLDYQTYDDGTKSLTREMVVQPDKNISYQRHSFRNELWTIVKGSGILLLNGNYREIKSGEHAFIKAGDLHAIKAIEELHIIEVQIGTDLTEQDAERFSCEWEQE